MSEAKLEGKLREKVKKLGGIAIKFFVLSFTGFPDRIVIMPGGKIWFVELKNPLTKRKPSDRQLFVHAQLQKLGFTVWIVNSNETLSEFLKQITGEI